MKGSGSSVTSASQGLIENRIAAVISDHQHVGGEVEQRAATGRRRCGRSRADARHQVAGALAAEVLQRQLEQVLEGGGAQVGADALGHQRQHVGARPAQHPGEQRRGQQAAQQQPPSTVSIGCPFW
jgi:hypothetical protein